MPCGQKASLVVPPIQFKGATACQIEVYLELNSHYFQHNHGAPMKIEDSGNLLRDDGHCPCCSTHLIKNDINLHERFASGFVPMCAEQMGLIRIKLCRYLFRRTDGTGPRGSGLTIAVCEGPLLFVHVAD